MASMAIQWLQRRFRHIEQKYQVYFFEMRAHFYVGYVCVKCIPSRAMETNGNCNNEKQNIWSGKALIQCIPLMRPMNIRASQIMRLWMHASMPFFCLDFHSWLSQRLVTQNYYTFCSGTQTHLSTAVCPQCHNHLSPPATTVTSAQCPRRSQRPCRGQAVARRSYSNAWKLACLHARS